MSYYEIGKELGIKPESVKYIANRAMQKFKDELAKRSIDVRDLIDLDE